MRVVAANPAVPLAPSAASGPTAPAVAAVARLLATLDPVRIEAPPRQADALSSEGLMMAATRGGARSARPA